LDYLTTKTKQPTRVDISILGIVFNRDEVNRQIFILMVVYFSDMSDDETDEVVLSRGAKITRPLSLIVLWLLNKIESDKEYFDVAIESGEQNRKEVRKYFHAAFYDRSRWYLPTFMTVIILLSVEVFMTVSSGSSLLGYGIISYSFPLQSYGLLLDAAGAIIIALGLFRGIKGIQRDTYSQYASGATYGTPRLEIQPAPLSSTVRSTVDGFYGTLFLSIGFTIQFIAVSNIVSI
jgi:hypothetical protein